MKIIYCINGTYNSGGMERVLMNKANYLAEVLGYEVGIVTTEQKGRDHFFIFSPKIHFFDLGINYDDDRDKNLFRRLFLKQLKKKEHHKRLSQLLFRECPDVCVSMFDRDADFLYRIKDGSKKVLEYHFSRYSKLVSTKNRVIRWMQAIRIAGWKFMVRRYDRFVVLTEEDKKAWGNIPNMEVIPNFIRDLPAERALLLNKRVVSVGRLNYQKGFDRLIKVWQRVHRVYPDWQLYIFGDGEKRQELEASVEELQLSDCIFLMPVTSDIVEEYLKSSVYVLCSRYEGFPMVLLEAISYGLPIVSFDCPCGPRDLIRKSFGSLVPDGETETFAKELMNWMADVDKRKRAGENARRTAGHYLQQKIMKKWQQLFESLV